MYKNLIKRVLCKVAKYSNGLEHDSKKCAQYLAILMAYCKPSELSPRELTLVKSEISKRDVKRDRDTITWIEHIPSSGRGYTVERMNSDDESKFNIPLNLGDQMKYAIYFPTENGE